MQDLDLDTRSVKQRAKDKKGKSLSAKMLGIKEDADAVKKPTASPCTSFKRERPLKEEVQVTFGGYHPSNHEQSARGRCGGGGKGRCKDVDDFVALHNTATKGIDVDRTNIFEIMMYCLSNSPDFHQFSKYLSDWSVTPHKLATLFSSHAIFSSTPLPAYFSCMRCRVSLLRNFYFLR
jgi:hypothetical protein